MSLLFDFEESLVNNSGHLLGHPVQVTNVNNCKWVEPGHKPGQYVQVDSIKERTYIRPKYIVSEGLPDITGSNNG